jgi:hypothetical protein
MFHNSWLNMEYMGWHLIEQTIQGGVLHRILWTFVKDFASALEPGNARVTYGNFKTFPTSIQRRFDFRLVFSPSVIPSLPAINLLHWKCDAKVNSYCRRSIRDLNHVRIIIDWIQAEIWTVGKDERNPIPLEENNQRQLSDQIKNVQLD